ncbi:MAG: 50S ribosomal protein L37ae [Thermoplasmata archaeon]|nr:50S ribosomal protein L37ae [Thermoplasmata archaeon]
MTRKTVKVGPTGRLGARYGVTVRRRIREVEIDLKRWHSCPKCKAKSVRRRATGIWVCRHCGAKFASSAYTLAKPRAITKEVTQVLEEKKLTPEEMAEVAIGHAPGEDKEED